MNSDGISLAAGFNFALAFANANDRLVQDLDTGMLVMTQPAVWQSAPSDDCDITLAFPERRA